MRIIIKRNLKYLTRSLIVALTLATPQLVSGSDREAGEPDTSSLVTNSSPVKNIVDPSEGISLAMFDLSIRTIIVTHAAIGQILDPDSPFDLALVCEEWSKIIISDFETKGDIWKAWYGVLGHEEAYQTFLNGVLLYKPDSESDEGKIEFKISDLPNPLDASFDLSGCGTAGQYLRIYTGYRKGVIPENQEKLEVRIAPWFLIKKHVESTASNFKDIMEGWNAKTAPVGIFFTWGNWYNLGWYEHLTWLTTAEISSMNLYEHWSSSADSPTTPNHMTTRARTPHILRKISCSFCELK